jgi:hypothetical protein
MMLFSKSPSTGFRGHSRSSIPFSTLILMVSLSVLFFIGAIVIDTNWVSQVQKYPLTSNVVAGILTVPLGLLLGIYLIDRSRERMEDVYWTSTQELRVRTVTKYLFRLARLLVNEFRESEIGESQSGVISEDNPEDFSRVIGLASSRCIAARKSLAATVSQQSSAQVAVAVAVIAASLEAIAETDVNHWVNGESEMFREWSIRFDRQPAGALLTELQEEIALHLAMTAQMLANRT